MKLIPVRPKNKISTGFQLKKGINYIPLSFLPNIYYRDRTSTNSLDASMIGSSSNYELTVLYSPITSYLTMYEGKVRKQIYTLWIKELKKLLIDYFTNTFYQGDAEIKLNLDPTHSIQSLTNSINSLRYTSKIYFNRFMESANFHPVDWMGYTCIGLCNYSMFYLKNMIQISRESFSNRNVSDIQPLALLSIKSDYIAEYYVRLIMGLDIDYSKFVLWEKAGFDNPLFFSQLYRNMYKESIKSWVLERDIRIRRVDNLKYKFLEKRKEINLNPQSLDEEVIEKHDKSLSKLLTDQYLTFIDRYKIF